MYVNNSIACGRVKNMTHRSLGLYDINCIAGERMHNTTPPHDKISSGLLCVCPQLHRRRVGEEHEHVNNCIAGQRVKNTNTAS